MQNNAAALYDLKMPWIMGYLPAKNIGTAVKEKMIMLHTSDMGFLEPFVATADTAA